MPTDYAREAPASLAWAPLRRPARLPLHVTWRHDPTPGAQVLLEALARTVRATSFPASSRP
ncbi:hypothetical protein EXU32_15865 [Janibacter limosus]|uniref:Uncharacterized protein n=1 Tax=Janibacter limosus TaxID=53458 RepID=A0A4P6MX11_9MICO|nr:hypothetical protein EXU32_15865 [Janibacter limosus]